LVIENSLEVGAWNLELSIGSARACAESASRPACATAPAYCHVDRKSCPERSRMGGDISCYFSQL